MAAKLLTSILIFEIFYISIFDFAFGQDENPIVTVPGVGTIMGATGNSAWTDRTFYQFHGIPFGKPPINERRFLPPEPADPLGDEVFNATGFGSKCPQSALLDGILPFMFDVLQGEGASSNMENREMSGQEDCLNLNVFTPKLNASDDLLPVMFFIYGGGFTFGETTYYLPGRILEKDVVLVTVNYRLGALGFLNLGVDEIPGNAGLFDQLLALQWVHDHIDAFGGDPGKVTLWGESAGAASVTFHMLSPLSKGLFHSVITESGSALSNWALRPLQGVQTNNFAEKVNCSRTTLEDLIECLRTTDVQTMTEAATGFWSPCVQTAGAIRFLEEEPSVLIQRGDYNHVPGIFGANKNEGSLFVAGAYEIAGDTGIFNNTDFFKYDAIPLLLASIGVQDPTRAVTDAVEERYLPGVDYSDLQPVVDGMVDIFGVFFLKAPTYRWMQVNSRYNDSYWYGFNYKGRFSVWQYLIGGEIPYTEAGVAHADELQYLMIPTPLPLNREERHVSERMVSLWTNFAIYGTPTPDGTVPEDAPVWPKYDLENEQYLDIDVNFTVKTDYTRTYNTHL